MPDMNQAKEFYTKLGFHVVWSRQNGDANDYMIMERHGTLLNFWPGNKHVWEQPYFKNFPRDTKRGYGVEIVYTTDNIQDYYDQVKEFANIVEPLKKKPWGLHDFRLEDPFGYYLRISEPHDIRDAEHAID